MGRVDTTVLPVAAVAIAVALGFGLVVPVLPLFVRSFGVSPTDAGLVVSVFSLVRLLFDVPAGRIVDRIGPAPAMAAGTGLVGVSSLLVAFAPSFEWLVVLRGAGGVGSALFSASLTAYVLARVPPERVGSAMGTVSAAFMLGSIFGPTVGGLASGELGLRAPFLLYGGFCGLAALIALLVVGPASREAHARAAAHGGARLTFSPMLLTALLATFSLWWLIGGFRFLLVPLYGRDELLLNEAQIGLGITASSLANLLVLWPAGRAADRLGPRLVGVPAFLLLGLTGLAFLPAQGLGGYLIANALFGLIYGFATVVPGVLLARVLPAGRSGSVAGLSSFSGDLGGVIGPVALGSALTGGGYPLAIVLSGIPAILAALGIAATPLRPPARAPSEPAATPR